jgi:hypothetical protein
MSPATTKLVVVSQGSAAADGLDLPETVAIFDLNNVIHIVFVAYMIYIIFESSSFLECMLLIKMLMLVGLCAFAYHIFVSDESGNGCCIRALPAAAAVEPTELEEEKEILLNTPVTAEKEGEEETEEFAELLKDPAVSPPRKSSTKV